MHHKERERERESTGEKEEKEEKKRHRLIKRLYAGVKQVPPLHRWKMQKCAAAG